MITFEKLSIRACSKICRKDLKLVSSTKDYLENDKSYWVLINSWYNLTFEYAPFAAEQLLTRICNCGLIPVIKECDAEASKFTQDTGEFSPFSHLLINEISVNAYSEHERIFLEILRFPKRFSPLHADIIAKETIIDFLNTENKCKLRQRLEFPTWLITAVRENLKEFDMRLHQAFLKGPEDYSYNLSYFSEGNCQGFLDGRPYKCRTLSDKLRYCYAAQPFNPSFTALSYFVPIRSNFHKYERQEFSWSNGRLCSNIITEESTFVDVVPKSYKSGRIICNEEADRQYYNSHIARLASGILQNVTRATDVWTPLEDQEVSRTLCRLASIDCSLATIDLSHASDLLSSTLVQQLLPATFALTCRPDRKFINGKDKGLLQMFLPAGSVMTFVTETAIFWGIARTAIQYADLCNGFHSSLDIQRRDGDFELAGAVYGDDIIIPSEAAETCMDFLELLGLSVNREKSFYGPNPYREACGCEAYRGVDVSSSYFPRKTLSWKEENLPTTLMALVDLQHRMFEHKRASAFLCSVVRDISPGFTSSNPSEMLDDLWEEFPSHGTLIPPHRYKERVPEQAVRPSHSTLRVSYDCTGLDVNNQTNYERKAAFEMFCYHEFLYKGPYYESPLDELLKVSSVRRPWKHEGKPSNRIVKA